MQTGRRAPSGDMRLSVTLEPDGEYTPTYGFSGKLAGRGADARFEGKLRISRDLPPLVEDAPQLDPAEVGRYKGIQVWPFAVSIIIFSLIIDKVGYKFSMIFAFASQFAWAIMGVVAQISHQLSARDRPC